MAEEAKNEQPKEITPQQAINILVQGVELAQKAGVYSLKDAAVISTAVQVFVKPPEVEATPEAPVAETTEESAPADLKKVD